MHLPQPPLGVELTAADPRFVPRRRREADAANDSANPHCFPEVETAIASSIDELGGEVFVKLESVAPVDASWIALNGSLKVTNAGQAFALLKASERVGHFLDIGGIGKATGKLPLAACSLKPFEAASDAAAASREVSPAAVAAPGAAAPAPLHLVLRTWYELHSQREYRAFVRDKRVVGVCSRYPSEAAAAAVSSAGREPEDGGAAAEDAAAPAGASAGTAPTAGSAAFRSSLLAFLQSSVLPIVPPPLHSFAADVYVDKKGRGWLLDIAPLWTGGVDLIAFTPEELGLPPAAADDDVDAEPAADGGAPGAAAGAGTASSASAAASVPRACPTCFAPAAGASTACAVDAGAAATRTAAAAAGEAVASRVDSGTVLWRIGVDALEAARSIAGGGAAAAPTAGPEPPAASAAASAGAAGGTGAPAAAAAAGAACLPTPHISLPKMAANRFPDELLLLAGSTGRSIADIIGDLEGAVRAAGLAGDAERGAAAAGGAGGAGLHESLFRRGNGSDSDSDSDRNDEGSDK